MKIIEVILTGTSEDYYKIHLCNEKKKWLHVELKSRFTKILIFDFRLNNKDVQYYKKLSLSKFMSCDEAYHKLKNCTYTTIPGDTNKPIDKPVKELMDQVLDLLLKNSTPEKLDYLIKTT